MNSARTDSSFFETKVKLRLDNLPKAPVNVLDCFAGSGRIWRTIRKRLGRADVNVLSIDQKKNASGVYLAGDNVKFLAALDLGKFNVIDLDAWGVPFEQLEVIFAARPRPQAVVFVTFIQSVFGRLPAAMLEKIGYSRAMLAKCPTLFNRHGLEKFKGYLAQNGVEKICRYSAGGGPAGKKHYMVFKL